ncbi:MAG: hypothetical protein ACON5F_08070 [Jejuia sp.]
MKNKKLHSIKTTGFKTPKGYFDSFDEQLLQKMNIESKLNKTISSGFKTPENYFEGLEERLIKQVSEEKSAKVISLFSRKSLVYASSIAATVLLLISLSVFNNTPEFDDLETQTVENYIIDENFSSYEIAALIDQEDLNETNFVNHNFDEEVIADYLLEHADIESLMIE